MSILKRLGKLSFDVETTKLLASSFDKAWFSLQISGSAFAADKEAPATRDRLAQRMIEIAQGGERNQLRLIDGALAQFAEPSGSGAAPI